MKNLVFVLLVLTSFGCEFKEVSFHVPKTNIVSVYFHEQHRFSVGILNADKTISIVPIPIPANLPVPFRIISNVDSTKGMWYECNLKYFNFEVSPGGACSIHVRSIDDVNTGGWNHGKFGSGVTRRIQ
jgi:hypothetical protein